MNRRGLGVLMLALALFPTALAAREIKEKRVRMDSARLSSVRKIALISVYGPTTAVEGLARSTKIQLTPMYDQAEQIITAGLQQNGYEVVPVAATRAAVESDYIDLYVDALKASSRSEKEKARAESERETLKAKRFNKFSVTPVASSGTSYVYPASYEWPSGLHFHVEDDTPVLVKDTEVVKGGVPIVEQPPAVRAALGALAQKLGADAAMIVRVVPDMTRVYIPPPSNNKGVFGLGSAIRDMKNGIKGLKTGDDGSNVLDAALFDVSGQSIFQASVITRSKEDIGNLMGGIVRGRGEEPSSIVMKEALDSAIVTTFTHLTGKALAASTPGLGTGGLKEAAAQTASKAAATKEEISARLSGTWFFETANGAPLPFNWSNGTVVTGGEYIFRPDGTFTSNFQMLVMQAGVPGEKNTKMDGTYTIFPDGSIVLKGKGILAKLYSTLLAPMTMTSDDTLSAAQDKILFVYRRKA